MKCDKFKCVYDVDGECDQDGGECIGDMCECFGECTDCQEQDRNDCDGLKKQTYLDIKEVYIIHEK